MSFRPGPEATEAGRGRPRPFPRDQGEANTGPEVFRRGSRDKNPYQVQAGGERGERAEKGEGPEKRVRAPSARMQHCDKARPGTEGGGGARLRRPGASSPLTPRLQAASLSTLDPSERAVRESTVSAPKAPEEPNKMATPPSPFLLPPLPARGAGAHTRLPPQAHREAKSLSARERGFPRTRHRRLALSHTV